MMGILANGPEAHDTELLAELLRKSDKYSALNFVKDVSVPKPVIHGDAERRIALIDCGAKLGIVRNLMRRGFQVVRVPYDSTYSTISKFDPAGVVISNGPGDPQMFHDTAKCVESLVDSDLPVLGICFGEQILGMSQGGRTFKLKYGHRGQNKPCVDLTTGKGYVTSQNHGYALDPRSLSGSSLKPWFMNADDKTVEGVFHERRPCFAVQFHPEATPGPYDTNFVFDKFVEACGRERKRGEQIRSVRA